MKLYMMQFPRIYIKTTKRYIPEGDCYTPTKNDDEGLKKG